MGVDDERAPAFCEKTDADRSESVNDDARDLGAGLTPALGSFLIDFDSAKWLLSIERWSGVIQEHKELTDG